MLDYAEMADKLLESAGFYETFSCKMQDVCKKYYKIDKCTKENCYLLNDIRNDNVPDEVWKKLAKNVSISTTNLVGDELICPRSLQSMSKIIKRCENKSCHFYSNTMAFHCMLLHGKAFFPDEDIPRRAKEVCTRMSEKTLDEYEEIGIYLMRVYLILFKYGIENLKMEYKLSEFQTKYVYKFLECIDGVIETCPKCGAVVKSRVKKKVKIGNSTECYFHSEISCGCEDPEVLKRRLEVVHAWKKMLENEDYSKDLLKISYRKLNRSLGDRIGKIQFMRFLLSEFNFDGLYLKQLPIGYVLRAYKLLFGKFIPANFGLTRKNGNLLINLFDEEQSV